MPRWIWMIIVALIPLTARADDPEAIARGKKALTTRAFSPAPWSFAAYENVWKQWQPKLDKAPEKYDEAFRERYGLHPAPYENGKYPMGMRPGQLLLFKGLTTDCMICHGGSIFGKSYIGLGNSALDIQAFFEDLNRATGMSGKLPHIFSNVRGTSEAGSMAVYLQSFRNPDLTVKFERHKFEIKDNMCEDVPAWWLLKKKKTMYHTGSANSRSVRSIMQFMLTPDNGPAVFEKEEATFRDIQAYLLSLEAPKYPFDVDAKLADTGRKTFIKTCAKCHGTYGEDASYPNKVIPLKEIGTDSARYFGLPPKLGEFYDTSWFAKEKPTGYKNVPTDGYLAPPLDGVWATAPYFHNGSVPTLYNVLNSKSRPKLYTRSFKTDEASYDKKKIGWQVQVLDAMPKLDNAFERRKIYDTTQPGRGNQGHTFGDELTDEQRWALIEYLKTI
jgi:mono/diheme cytochrome c family protein